MSRHLPLNPHIDVLKKQAKALLSDHQTEQPEALRRVAAVVDDLPPGAVQGFSLRHAQQVLAREYEFSSWQALVDHVQGMSEQDWAVGRFAFYQTLADDLVDSYRAGNTSTYGVLGDEMNRRMQAKVDETAAAQGAICALAECQDWAELGSLARSSIDNRGIDRKMLADLAVREPDAFKVIVDEAQAALSKAGPAAQSSSVESSPAEVG